DGERHLRLRVQRLEADHPGADHTRIVPELRKHDPNGVATRLEGVALDDLTSRGTQEVERGFPEAAADHDQLRLERVHVRRHRGADVAADPGEQRHGLVVAGLRQPDKLALVDALAEPVSRLLAGSPTRRIGLEVPAAAARARPAVELHDDVTELRAASGRAAIWLAAEDQPAADSGSERQHHDVVGALRSAGLPFGD